MGLVNAKASPKSSRQPELEPVEAVAQADSGAVHLRIPEHVRIQLELEGSDRAEARRPQP